MNEIAPLNRDGNLKKLENLTDKVDIKEFGMLLRD